MRKPQPDQFYSEWPASFTLLTEYRRLRWQAWAGVLEPGAWLALWTVARQVATPLCQ